MVYRANGYMGCLVGILFMIVFFYIIRLTGWVIFGTPVGLVIVGYFVYRYFKKQKNVGSSHYETHTYESNEQHGFDKEDVVDVVDVDYEDIDE